MPVPPQCAPGPQLTELLLTLYPPEEIDGWIMAPNRLYGTSPAEMIMTGQEAEVLRLLQEATDGIDG